MSVNEREKASIFGVMTWNLEQIFQPSLGKKFFTNGTYVVRQE